MLPEVDQLATVVVCEDDEPTLELLCDHLTADRFRALPAPCASDALRLCHFEAPDLLLLDLRLPDASGLDVLREIRAADGSSGRFDPGLAVVVLSGRGSPADRTRGLNEGADDYLVKPFTIDELVARVRAVLRRRATRREGPRRIGELSIDPATREVRVAGRSVELANKEFALTQRVNGFPERFAAIDYAPRQRLRQHDAGGCRKPRGSSCCRERIRVAGPLDHRGVTAMGAGPELDSPAMVRQMLRVIVAAALVLSAGLPVSASAASRSCPPVVNPYDGSRYEGVDLTGIKAKGVSCATARKVARRAHAKALKKAPEPDGTLDLHWRKWDVRGNLKQAHDRYVATRGPDRVRWRF